MATLKAIGSLFKREWYRQSKINDAANASTRGSAGSYLSISHVNRCHKAFVVKTASLNVLQYHAIEQFAQLHDGENQSFDECSLLLKTDVVKITVKGLFNLVPWGGRDSMLISHESDEGFLRERDQRFHFERHWTQKSGPNRICIWQSHIRDLGNW